MFVIIIEKMAFALARLLLPLAISTAPSIIKAIRGHGKLNTNQDVRNVMKLLTKKHLLEVARVFNSNYAKKNYSKLKKPI